MWNSSMKGTKPCSCHLLPGCHHQPPHPAKESPADDVFLQWLLLDLWRFLLPFYRRGLHVRTEQCKREGSSCTGFDAHKTFGTVTKVIPMPGHEGCWLVPAPCVVFPLAPSSQPFPWVPLVPPAPSPTRSFASWGQEQIHPTEAKQKTLWWWK